MIKGIQAPRILTDQIIVAAVNGCIDLEKYKKLPKDIKKRFGELLQHNRIKAVCFMESSGLGLRTYRDKIAIEKPDEDFDEVELTPGLVGSMDLAGSWIRCPAAMYQAYLDGEDKFVVADKTGKRFVTVDSRFPSVLLQDREDEDEECDESEDDFDWDDNRDLARVFTKEGDARDVARRVECIVLVK